MPWKSVEIPGFSAQGLCFPCLLFWSWCGSCPTRSGAWSRVLERHEDADSLPHPCFPRECSPALRADLAECGWLICVLVNVPLGSAYI